MQRIDKYEYERVFKIIPFDLKTATYTSENISFINYIKAILQNAPCDGSVEDTRMMSSTSKYPSLNYLQCRSSKPLYFIELLSLQISESMYMTDYINYCWNIISLFDNFQ